MREPQVLVTVVVLKAVLNARLTDASFIPHEEPRFMATL
jgi:hypothetical protein